MNKIKTALLGTAMIIILMGVCFAGGYYYRMSVEPPPPNVDEVVDLLQQAAKQLSERGK